jgi:hypothetical protein
MKATILMKVTTLQIGSSKNSIISFYDLIPVSPEEKSGVWFLTRQFPVTPIFKKIKRPKFGLVAFFYDFYI